MELAEEDYKLVDLLLKHDLNVFAKSLNLIEEDIPLLEDRLAVRLINLAERISRKTTDIEYRNTALLICALVWEHRQDSWNAISSFLVQILNRLGLSPSAQMVDPEYDSNNQIHSSLGSLFSEIRTNLKIQEHEVRVGNGGTIILSSFQKEMWDLLSGQFPRVGISAPTSAGKSFVLAARLVDSLYRKPQDIFYIVPTITLINQVSKDIRLLVRNQKVENLRVLQSFELSAKDRGVSSIYVMTQERALSALRNEKFGKGSLDILIVDEVQNIERVANEGDERSKDLYNLIHIIENDVNPSLAVVCGPRLKNIDSIAGNLFNSPAVTLKADLPPVINLTYSFSQSGSSVYFNQYYSENSYPQRLSIDTAKVPPDLFGKIRYNDKIYQQIRDIISCLPDSSGTLVFSPTKNQAKNTAKEIAKIDFVNVDSADLSKYVRETVHDNYPLADCIERGVAYHHSGVPPHIRNAVENGFSKKYIKIITCTTTLMQGVNLPAKNLIARNPYLSAKRNGPELTPYEFANLRGRAGRLLKDFVGRAIILDENTFDESQIDLFEYPEKEVSTGYSEKYDLFREGILNSLSNNYEASESTRDYSDLMSHIRTTVLRYGRKASARLMKSGIEIPDDILDAVRKDVANLRVPRKLCLDFNHWDPLVLDKIYLRAKNEEVHIPRTPYDSDYVERLLSNINFVRNIAPIYYEKYLNINDDRFLFKLVKCSQSWGRELPLKQVISWKSNMSGDEVENMLQMLLTTVMYSLPKFLSPLYSILEPDSSLLSVIESGIHSPITRKFSEMGLPREVSIRIKELVERDIKPDIDIESFTEIDLRSLARSIRPQLNQWELVQLDEVVI